MCVSPLWKAASVRSARVRRAELCGSLTVGSFAPVPLLLGPLLLTRWTHLCLFYILGYNPILLNFVPQTVLASAFGHCEPTGPCVSETSLTSMCMSVCTRISTSLPSGTTRCSRHILQSHYPSPVLSPVL